MLLLAYFNTLGPNTIDKDTGVILFSSVTESVIVTSKLYYINTDIGIVQVWKLFVYNGLQ